MLLKDKVEDEMGKKPYIKLQMLLAVTIIILLMVYMVFAIKYERPSETELNYSDTSFEVVYVSDSTDFRQSLGIFKNDRTIKSIRIYLENNLQENDVVSISVDNGSDVKTVIVGYSDFSTGWYTLPFSYEEVDSTATLIISAEKIKGTLGLGVTAIDYMNVGECTVDGINYSNVIAIQTYLIINNLIWDKWGYILIIVFCLTSLVGVLLSCKYDDNTVNGKVLFLLAIVTNIISLIVLDPYFMDTSHIAENSLNFYYLTQKYSILESLTKMDAGYLPLLQRLIAIIYIKVFSLGTNALYCMQITGMLIDIVIFSAFNLYTFRGRVHRSIRFALSLCMFLLFIHPTMSTYFNFIYVGYFLIALLLTANLNELKKYQFVLLCVFSVFVCLSKGFYAVMLPIGIIELILFYRTAGKRKNIYASTISVAATLQVGYAFLIGDGWNIWFSNFDLLHSIFRDKLAFAIITLLVLVCMGALILINVLKYWRKISQELQQKWMNTILLAFLFMGSAVIGTIAFKRINFINLFDWGCAWYDPSAMALILLLCELAGMAAENKKSIGTILAIGVWIIMGIDVVMSLSYSRNKLYYSYRCVSWDVYKDYFDRTLVPVFMYDQRFGTLADGYTMWYTGAKPVDNYAYGAPYNISYMELEAEEPHEYVNSFYLEKKLVDQALSGVYLNYTNGVGNVALQLLLYDEEGHYLDSLQQISPLSSKTIGFFSDEPVTNVAYLVVQTTEGEAAYVTKDAYFVTR